MSPISIFVRNALWRSRVGWGLLLMMFWKWSPSEAANRLLSYKNSFYNNFSLVPSLLPKNRKLALALENWKDSAIKCSVEIPSSLDFINQYQIFCEGLWACFNLQQLQIFLFNSFNLSPVFTALSDISILINESPKHRFTLMSLTSISNINKIKQFTNLWHFWESIHE